MGTRLSNHMVLIGFSSKSVGRLSWMINEDSGVLQPELYL